MAWAASICARSGNEPRRPSTRRWSWKKQGQDFSVSDWCACQGLSDKEKAPALGESLGYVTARSQTESEAVVVIFAMECGTQCCSCVGIHPFALLSVARRWVLQNQQKKNIITAFWHSNSYGAQNEAGPQAAAWGGLLPSPIPPEGRSLRPWSMPRTRACR